MSEGVDLPIRDLRLVAKHALYLGAASVYVFESAVDEDDPLWAVQLSTQFLGYDCWAFIGSLHQGDLSVGALVLPFGPWTMEHEAVVNRLDQTSEGVNVDLSELLDLFPEEVQVTETFTSTEGIIIAGSEELELPFEKDKAVLLGLTGELSILTYADDEDWVDGPILILQSDLID